MRATERAKWRKGAPSLLGWTFAAFVVAVALFGPPLTGQRIPNLIELRHDILMIDREFERWSLRSETAFAADNILVRIDVGRAANDSTKSIAWRRFIMTGAT